MGAVILNRRPARRRNQSLFDEPGGLDRSQIHAAGIAAAERFGTGYGKHRFEEWWKSEGRERSNLTQSDARRAFLEGFEEVEGPTIAADLDQWDIRQEGARRAEAAEADLWNKPDRQFWGERHFNVWWNSFGKSQSSLGPILSKENFLRGWMATYEPTDNRGRRNPSHDPNESVQERSYRESRENFERVSTSPETATVNQLERAIHYLSHARNRIQRAAWAEGKKVDGNVIAGFDAEEDYYIRLIREKRGRR